MLNKMQVCVVCMANYCRSPVMENLLRVRFEGHEFMSAGINPIPKASMDKRSSDFLASLGIKNLLHAPKRISSEIIKSCDLVLALDIMILHQLNLMFPKYRKKFKLCTQSISDIEIEDPYNHDMNNYFLNMKKIQKIVDNIELEDFLS